jgi:aldose 1-epimerase
MGGQGRAGGRSGAWAGAGSAACWAAVFVMSMMEIVMSSVPAADAVQVPESRVFGRLPDGREARLYTLEAGGYRATITDFGAILTAFHVPTADGTTDTVDVVLGFDDLAGYVAPHPYFGATCGRVSNRIAGGRFTLDGAEYQLATNNGPNHLHGGTAGFDKKLWKATPRMTERGPAVELEVVSPAGDESYPGRLTARCVYTLTPAGELWVEMSATTDAPTVVNLVHHSYWNLAGQATGSIAGHELAVGADRYLPVDATSIPTGVFAPVEGTPFDFRPERRPWGRVGHALETLPPDAAPGTPRGVDHNYVLRSWKPDAKPAEKPDSALEALELAATLRDPASGRTLEVLTDQPGIQVYMGNFLDGTLTGKDGAVYGPNAGICLETQKFPDSVHHPDWPSMRLDPGQTYRHTMVHRFSRYTPP